jgi:Transmembrane secretion effector
VSAHPPLRRNRDFVLLQTGRLLSTTGSGVTSIAYPLLVLAATGSAAKAGIVGFARILPSALLSLPAGVAADRCNRKWLMVAADGVRAATIASLVAAVLLHRLEFWQVPLVAFAEGVGQVVFAAAEAGAFRSVVPPSQLPAAAATQQARRSFVQVAAPALGGALFQVGRSLPFIADLGSYTFSIVSLLLMRTPFREPRERDTAPLRAQLAEGFRFL